MFDIKREPTHPGDILLHEFMEPLGLTQTQLAKDIGTTFRTVNEVINKKRGISAEMAIKLSRYFGTSEEVWLNLQTQYELYKVKGKKRKTLERVRAYTELHAVAV